MAITLPAVIFPLADTVPLVRKLAPVTFPVADMVPLVATLPAVTVPVTVSEQQSSVSHSDSDSVIWPLSLGCAAATAAHSCLAAQSSNGERVD